MRGLIEAYKNTKYVVTGTSIIIEIGKCNADLDGLLLKQGCIEWAFITAWNPFSNQLDDVENSLRHEKLLTHVSHYKYYEGYGVGEDSSWVPEKSLLVIGISRQTAIEIGNVFEQNAIVIGKKDFEAELVLRQGNSIV